MAEFLLELKVEEIPSGMQLAGEQALVKAFDALLNAHGIAHGGVQSASMSSRIALWVEGLPQQTEAKTEERRGPRADAAFDADGNPTKPLQGFMKSCGIDDANQLETRETEKGAFVFYNTTVAGRPVADLLAAELPQMIKNIPWPKSMRWGDGDMTFVRPLTNVCAILDGVVLNFEVDGLASNNQSFGHFFMHPEAFTVESAAQYQQQLETRKVMLSRQQREETIIAMLHEEASKLQATWVEDMALVREVAGLIEWPYAVISKVDDAFLDLPREVLIITMASHQKYFTLDDKNGNLMAHFVGISNVPDVKGLIPAGYAKVLTARFEDAKFYWDLDCRTKLADRWSALENIVFQKDLGTIAEKMTRVSQLVPNLADYIKGMDVDQTQRVARLAKGDLNAGVVFEFPELQGIMGGYYAQRDGEAQPVVAAIRNQYENNDFAEMDAVSQGFILADRLDTLVGFFGINQPPTGSKDPFALRRAALSIIRLLRQHNVRVPLRQVLTAAFSAYDGALSQSDQGTVDAVMDFFMARLQVALKEEGVDHDLVAAVFAQGLDDIVDICNRAQALQQFMDGMGGGELHEAFKRATNILSQTKTDAKVEQSAFVEAAEETLFTACNAAEGRISIAVEGEQYVAAMEALADLRTPLNSFFADVMVMADDTKLRQNRVALLGYTTSLFAKVADFGQLSR